MKRQRGYYSISVVAKMFSVHQQTIRLYEKEGLISPKRSTGNTRLFSEEDVDRLEEIIYLTHKMGVNLAGVEMILKLQKKINNLQDEINKAFANTREELMQESTTLHNDAKKHAQRLIEMKHDGNKTLQRKTIDITNQSIETKDDETPEVVDDWEVDYEDKS